jgi:DnaJ-class molecular chaperone
MIGPGMAAINRMQCPPCKGKGGRIGLHVDSARVRVYDAGEDLDVKIQPGMKVGEFGLVKECSDNHDYHEAGDVHIVSMRPMRIDGVQARGYYSSHEDPANFSGVSRCAGTLPGHPAHPDGLVVDIPPGIMSGNTHTVEGKGMPQRQSGGYGNPGMSYHSSS